MLLTRMSSHGRILFVEMILSAALAQLVERRLGKAEVGGSNPLGSSSKNRNTFLYSVFFFFQSGLISTFICTNLFLSVYMFSRIYFSETISALKIIKI